MRSTAKRIGMAAFAAGLLWTFSAAFAADDEKEKQPADKQTTEDKDAKKSEKRSAGKEAKKSDKPSTASKNSVAVFRLRGDIVETPREGGILFATEHSISLKDLVARLTKAGDDEAVKAVVLSLEGAHPSISQAEEVRQVLSRVREKGKKIYAHVDELSMGDYALLAGVDRLSVVPTGDLWLTGLYGESPYLRGLLDKLGVQPDFLTCGDYKSAAEMFMRDGPSPQAEEMQNWLLDDRFKTELRLIAEGRRVDVEQVKTWVDGGPYSASKAKEMGLIDAVEQHEEFEAVLKKEFGEQVKFNHNYGKKSQPELDLSSPLAALNIWAELLGGAKKKKTYKDSVAVVYVEGAITLGDSEGSPLGASGETASSTALRKALDKAAEDDTIKAVVLRVDSPGGSATASEIILSATKRVKAKKPFVVSMGGVAASGGYYVACGADTIYADESTITGSIGVVGGKLATNDLWKKVGVKWKGYQRGTNASILSSMQVFTPEQRQRMQAWMDEIYGVFKGHVTEARGDKLKKPIDELAGGRVYTGRQALELGLVDRIGTLDDAIKFIAGQAQLKEYEVRTVPEPKNFLEQLLEDAEGPKDDSQHVAWASANTLVTAAVPYLDRLDPQRVRAVLTALRHLETLRAEGAVLMAPEWVWAH
ncbi:MAG TPA: signal peptide peptidase SppA [Pirellulales bacterium]|nr:signal peptide peptidase SppA [Pirellulales bacterium]